MGSFAYFVRKQLKSINWSNLPVALGSKSTNLIPRSLWIQIHVHFIPTSKGPKLTPNICTIVIVTHLTLIFKTSPSPVFVFVADYLLLRWKNSWNFAAYDLGNFVLSMKDILCVYSMVCKEFCVYVMWCGMKEILCVCINVVWRTYCVYAMWYVINPACMICGM